ncbi:hypothetical protein O203_10775 [Ectopseudomonas chengduensis]|nr:hypothetical protein O203_10775 [Pseudomonas chengduensis]
MLRWAFLIVYSVVGLPLLRQMKRMFLMTRFFEN